MNGHHLIFYLSASSFNMVLPVYFAERYTKKQGLAKKL